MGKAIWEDVKKELGIRHNNGFTYENFDFKNMNSISLVTCPVHGDFKLSLNNHYYKTLRKEQMMLITKNILMRTLTLKGWRSNRGLLVLVTEIGVSI